jgi:hypothetical protein
VFNNVLYLIVSLILGHGDIEMKKIYLAIIIFFGFGSSANSSDLEFLQFSEKNCNLYALYTGLSQKIFNGDAMGGGGCEAIVPANIFLKKYKFCSISYTDGMSSCRVEPTDETQNKYRFRVSGKGIGCRFLCMKN